MKTLSSDATLFAKFTLPVVFILAALVMVFSAASQWRGAPISLWISVVFWIGYCVFLVWCALPIKEVHVSGDKFRISNYLREVEVPTAHLERYREDFFNRAAGFTLYFKPSTPFGRKIRIICPVSLFASKSFDDVEATLREIVLRNSPLEYPPVECIPARVAEILENPLLEKSSAVVGLSESELDYLIDHLPHDLPLRDIARRERQKRWYG